jgi:hypothetical protein
MTTRQRKTITGERVTLRGSRCHREPARVEHVDLGDRSMRVDRFDDPLAAARGIVRGTALGAALWIALAVVVALLAACGGPTTAEPWDGQRCTANGTMGTLHGVTVHSVDDGVLVYTIGEATFAESPSSRWSISCSRPQEPAE